MANFQRKSISQGQTLSEKLKQARLEKKLSITELSHQTKIQVKYLELLENGDYANLPGDVYVKTWIKIYAQTVGLPPHELLSEYKLEKQIGVKNKTKVKTKKLTWQEILKPKVMRWILIITIALSFLGYLAWEINDTISPPEIIITQPVNNYKTLDSSVLVVGQTLPEVQLKINNEIVLLDEQGKFSQNVNLATGLNNLEISAKKKHSKTNTITLVILRETIE